MEVYVDSMLTIWLKMMIEGIIMIC